MIITMQNYNSILPEKLHAQFRAMAGREAGRAIIYKDQVLRYANIDEYNYTDRQAKLICVIYRACSGILPHGRHKYTPHVSILHFEKIKNY